LATEGRLRHAIAGAACICPANWPAFALQTAGKNAIERLAESVTKPAFALQTAGNADFS
jgi:hypothetical protein